MTIVIDAKNSDNEDKSVQIKEEAQKDDNLTSSFNDEEQESFDRTFSFPFYCFTLNSQFLSVFDHVPLSKEKTPFKR